MTGNIVAGKNNGGYKYGGFAEKPPNVTRHYFTCNIIFTKKICKSTEFYVPYCKILPNFLSRLRICFQFQSKRLFSGKSAYFKYIIDDQYITYQNDAIIMSYTLSELQKLTRRGKIWRNCRKTAKFNSP